MRRLAVELLWLVVLLSLTIILGILLISGDILLYLAPRMVLIVWFGFVVLLVLLAYQLFCIAQRNDSVHDKNRFRINSLVFLIPIVLIMTVTPNENTSSALPNQNVDRLNAITENTIETLEKDDTTPPTTDQGLEQTIEPPKVGAVEDKRETIDVDNALPCVLVDKTIEFDSVTDLFSEYLYYSVDELAGQTVTLCGYVYSEESFPENTILISRLFISCCVADASIVGFHMKVENADEFEDGEWICVTGVIEKVSLEYYGEYQDFPILTNGTVTRIESPDTEDAYIYP